MRIVDRARFAYRALVDGPQRQLAPARVPAADAEFAQRFKRNKAVNNAIDLEHNLSLVGWMIRLHLSYVASFRFQARTADPVWNKELEAWWYERTQARNLDVQRRMGFDSMLRAFAAGKLSHGDALVLKVQGCKLQLFEAFQIAKGKDAPERVNDNGLVLDPFTAVEAYALATGDDSNTLTHRILAPWQDVIFQMCEVRPLRPTQTRGESPLLPVLDLARDYLDNRTYRLFRSKIEAMFGIVLFRDHSKKGAHDFQEGQFNVDRPPEEDRTNTEPLEYELRPGLKLELEKDEKAEFLESKTPGATWLPFNEQMAREMLAAYDIPYSAFDSSKANYSSARADMNRYKLSSTHERNMNNGAAVEMTEHIIRHDFAAGTMPTRAGASAEEIDFEHIPQGTFLLDLSKEIDAELKKVAAGVQTHDDLGKALNAPRSFRETVDILSNERAYAASKGVVLQIGATPGAAQTSDAPNNGEKTENADNPENQ